MKNESGIYLITCRPTSEKYVGSACNLSRRTKEHKYALNHGIHYNYKLQAEWERYTSDEFLFSVLELVPDKNLLLEREQFWMDAIKPEFNIAPTSRHPAFGIKRTEETRRKLSVSKKKQMDSMTPEQRDDFRLKIKLGREAWWESLNEDERREHINKISNPHSDETKKILRIRTLQAYVSGKLSRGRWPRSEETKRKLSEAATLQFAEQKLETARKRAEWELGREAREMERRRKLSEANSGKKLSKAQKEKLSAIAKAQWSDPEYIAKHKAAVTEAMQDPERKRKMRAAKLGKKLTKAHKEKIGQAGKGKKRSAATRRRLSEARKLWWAKRKAQQGV